MPNPKTKTKVQPKPKQQAPTQQTAPSPTVDPLTDPLIPPAPDPSGLVKPTLVDRSHGLLEQSESLGGHARAEHDGKGFGYLDGRGKKVATTFMSTYDQDKSFGAFMNGGAGSVFNNTKNVPAKTIKKGKNKGKVIPSNDIYQGDASGKGTFRTAPLARVSEEQPDGSHRHFNAKVKRGFAKFIHEGGKTRAQTFFPDQYEELEQPLPGGQVPTTRVKGNSIEDVRGKLRPTTTDERHGDPVGKVVERPVETPEVTAPVESSTPETGVIPPRPERPSNWSTMNKNQRRNWNRKLKKWEDRYGG